VRLKLSMDMRSLKSPSHDSMSKHIEMLHVACEFKAQQLGETSSRNLDPKCFSPVTEYHIKILYLP
jgi:hypothetical protein